MTSFIGRQKEIETVCALLSAHRLVTLTGSGGTGKTRLSLQAAGQLLENYPKGAWLVQLAPLADPELVAQAVASALGLPETPDLSLADSTVASSMGLSEMPVRSLIDSLIDFLRPKRLLLILDNCEHVLEACASLADTLLHACPDLSILASSREILGVVGEAPFRVPPLSKPDARHLPPLDKLTEYDAVRLFVARARIVSPGFAIAENNAAAVAQVVTRLDGIPLAIELAAARLRLLSLEQIALRLNDAFRLLTGGSRTVLPRHQTLRALIDWSYNLLSEPERILLRRLSVFAGSWTLESAEQVCAVASKASHPLSPEDILDLLSGLVDKSMVLAAQEDGAEMRYRMLETIRQYAHEKLVDEKEAQSVRTHLLGYYLRLVETLEPKLRGREQIMTLDRLEIELGNLRLALEWALQTDIEAELKLAASLQWFWYIRSHFSEGIEWLERGLEAEQDSRTGAPVKGRRAIIRAKALVALGFHRLHNNDRIPSGLTGAFQSVLERARSPLEEGLALYQVSDPEHRPEIRPGLAWAVLWLGLCKYDEGHSTQAQVMAHEALSLFRESTDPLGMAESLQLMAGCAIDPARKKTILLEQLAIYEAIGDGEGMASSLAQTGFADMEDGEYESACAAYEASLKHYRRVNNTDKVAVLWSILGFASQSIGDLQRANQCIDQSLASSYELGNDNWVMLGLFNKCQVAVAEGHYDQADELNEETWRLAQKTDSSKGAIFALYFRTRLARLRGDYSTAWKYAQECLSVSHKSGHCGMPALVELGQLALQNGDLGQAGSFWREGLQVLYRWREWINRHLYGLAILAAREGKVERAAHLFGTRWCRSYVNYLSPIERSAREAGLAAVQAALSDARFEQLFQEGQAMTFEQAVAYALEEHE